MALSWYNGHSPAKRERVQAWLNQQWAAGALPRPSRCVACGQNEGAIHGHLEDYDQPASYVELCITCHLMLHCRFRQRAAWETYRRRIADGWQAPPLSQREGFGVLRSGILASRWPEGTTREVAPGGTYLDTLPAARNGQQGLF